MKNRDHRQWKIWYNKNRKKILDRNRLWRKKNKNKWNRIVKKYKHKHRDRVNLLSREKYNMKKKEELRAQKLMVDAIIGRKDRKTAIKVSMNTKIDNRLRALLIKEFLL